MAGNSNCAFCGRPSTLLCDGRLWDNGKGQTFRIPIETHEKHTRTCDAPMCRECAKMVGQYHVNRGRKGCSWETIDICPDCQQAQDKPVEVFGWEV